MRKISLKTHYVCLNYALRFVTIGAYFLHLTALKCYSLQFNMKPIQHGLR